MEALSGLFAILVWVFIFNTIKKKVVKPQNNGKRGNPAVPDTREFPTKNVTGGIPVQGSASPVENRQPAGRAYVPVSAPKEEGEGSFVRNKGHVVEPLSDHAHQETSMTGFSECPPEKAHAEKNESVPAAPAAVPVGSFAFTREETVRAIVLSEILSKPKALRRG